MLKKWAQQIETQRRKYRERTSALRNSDGAKSAGGVSATEFSFMKNQRLPENPYKEVLEDDDDEDDGTDTITNNSYGRANGLPHSSFTQSRNGSSSSLRSRSTTAESAQSQAGRIPPPPRLPSGAMQNPALSLRTRELQQTAVSPGTNGPSDSYFSPVSESPMSTRTSSNSGVYPFPRQAIPPNGYYEDVHGNSRFTAPVMGRPQQNSPQTGYPPGRGPVGRPGFPPGAAMHSTQQMPGHRNRSASSPDIHNGPRMPARNAGPPPVPEVPAGFQYPNRSQNNSPHFANGVPGRTSGSPQALRERQGSMQQETSPTDFAYSNAHRPGMAQYPSAPGARTLTPVSSRGPTFSPPPPGEGMDFQAQPIEPSNTPAQLKVKVHCPSASQTLTLVVSTNITYQTLKDRIDAKLQRSTNLSLGDRGTKDGQDRIHVKLKYLDEDDYVSIQSDEDVQTAFETWIEQKGEGVVGMGEVELFCQR